jgi:hypothetical protein
MSLNIACTAAEVPASTRPTGASVTWPRYANPARTALLARNLPGSTYGALPPDDDWCGQRDGRLEDARRPGREGIDRGTTWAAGCQYRCEITRGPWGEIPCACTGAIGAVRTRVRSGPSI